MSIRPAPRMGLLRQPVSRRSSGAALVITLSLLVLVTIAVVAFFGRTSRNQLINSSSTNGIANDAYTDGAVDTVIGSLQKEMWIGSGSPAGTGGGNFPILPMTNNQAVVPSRSVIDRSILIPPTAPDPNSTYAQFANLVKQSGDGVPLYAVTASPSASPPPGPTPASSVLTTAPAADGRYHDGKYWNQPKLVSVSDTDNTNLTKLVPNWVYTDRSGNPNGNNPTRYTSGAGLEPSPSNPTLSQNGITGRYAYNIYDIGGLLNANVAGYGQGTTLDPSSSPPSAQIVPGYKGSLLSADLSGLALGGTAFTLNGANAGTFSNWQSKLPALRYPAGWNSDFAKLLTSGQYGGWLQPFLAPFDLTGVSGTTTGGGPLITNTFTSRQDLINWVTSQWNGSAASGSTSSAAWILPYLTHFSFDTDAPSYTPPTQTGRPQVTANLTNGGNDAFGSDGGDQGSINPPFTSILDATGNPLIKRRFPLSILSLFQGIDPEVGPASGDLADQIKYDFGLTWDLANKRWNYQDPENSGTIQRLSAVPKTRSPNFFELLKAAIVAGSLGKQWGEKNSSGTITFSNDVDNALIANGGNGKNGSVTYQILQIGANIISQSTTTYHPTTIALGAQYFSGVKDLPYFYRTRLVGGQVGTYTGTSMHIVGNSTADTPDYGHSQLGVSVVQPELWNPNAPNLISSTTGYPTNIRIVPSTPLNSLYVYTYYGTLSNTTTLKWQWKNGTTPGSLPGIVYGDYSPVGGIKTTNQVTYSGLPNPNAYIEVKSSPNTNGLYTTFREPYTLFTPGSANGLDVSSTPATSTLGATSGVIYDGQPNTQFAMVQKASPDSSNTSKTMLGFLVGYYCSHPSGVPGTPATLGIQYCKSGPLVLELQYSIDGSHYYTYDKLSCAFPFGGSGGGGFSCAIGSSQLEEGTRMDPRSRRWGQAWSLLVNSPPPYGGTAYHTNRTWSPSNTLNADGGTNRNPAGAPGWSGTYIGNVGMQAGWAQLNTIGAPASYVDPDGIQRSADGAYATAGNDLGMPQVTGNNHSRPVVLNRPFQSVAELGYVSRDTPWRSLDFFTPQSGDAALLDVFSTYGPDPYSYRTTLTTETGLVAGRVDLNTRQIPVLAAILKGAATVSPNVSNNIGGAVLDDAQATSVAKALTGWTTSYPNSTDYANKGPLRNASELVGKFVTSNTYSGFSSQIKNSLQGNEPPVLKQQQECVMRALSGCGTTRTWNLLIDLVAQSGQLSSGPTDLSKFVVSSEKHVWVSVAIDRVTGKIIKMQTELVRS